MVRGRGYLKSIADIESIAVGADARGTPLRVEDVARVGIGPDLRRGVAELDGEGEVVGGIVVMRFGENALGVIDRVKQRLEDVKASLPPGVRVVHHVRPLRAHPRLDRAPCATRSCEEVVVVSVMVLVFLLPRALGADPDHDAADRRRRGVRADVLPRRAPSNIMSLGGIALAIGELVDTSIVMVDNAYRRLSEPDAPTARPSPYDEQPREVVRRGAAGRAARSSSRWPSSSSRSCRCSCSRRRRGGCSARWRWTKTFAMAVGDAAGRHAGAGADDVPLRGRRPAPRARATRCRASSTPSTRRSCGWRAALALGALARQLRSSSR